jgi:hypothetical protein
VGGGDDAIGISLDPAACRVVDDPVRGGLEPRSDDSPEGPAGVAQVVEDEVEAERGIPRRRPPAFGHTHHLGDVLLGLLADIFG